MAWTGKPTKWIEGDTLHVSVPFTWNLPQLKADLSERDFGYQSVSVGGPAVELMPTYFEDMPWVLVSHKYVGALQKVNPLATRTTLGCIRKCSFCAVPKTEGAFVELEDWPDLPIVCDNNLLAASQPHFDRVCDRLEKWDGVDFNQGLDARLLNDYHAERLARIKGAIVRLALDHSKTIGEWQASFDLLRRNGVAKKRIRTYVLCGFGSDPSDAWKRALLIEKQNSYALPQWYHPLDAMEYGKVLKCHIDHGWNAKERDRIMQYFYKHRGTAYGTQEEAADAWEVK